MPTKTERAGGASAGRARLLASPSAPVAPPGAVAASLTAICLDGASAAALLHREPSRASALLVAAPHARVRKAEPLNRPVSWRRIMSTSTTLTPPKKALSSSSVVDCGRWPTKMRTPLSTASRARFRDSSGSGSLVTSPCYCSAALRARAAHSCQHRSSG